MLLTRRWRYAPFLVLLGVGAMLVMFAGFPNGTPFRRVLLFAYERAEPLQFLRTTYKIAPLLALSLACLGGAAAAALLSRARGAGRPVLWAAALVLPALFGLPLVTADAVDERQAYGEVPAHWSAAIADAERETPSDRRLAVLPGELFGHYRWGDTMDPIGPALSERPLLIREIVPYADRRSSQLQNVLDDLLQQDRLVPGQLERLLGLVGAARSGAGRRPSRAKRRARAGPRGAGAGGRGSAGAAPGELRRSARGGPRPGQGRAGARCRACGASRSTRRRARSAFMGAMEPLCSRATPMASPRSRRMASFPAGALRYAGDLSADELRAELERGGTLVLTDSNRRRVVNPRACAFGTGPRSVRTTTSPRTRPRSSCSRTRRTRSAPALYGGLSAIESPLQAGQAIFPEHCLFAAVDGDPTPSGSRTATSSPTAASSSSASSGRFRRAPSGSGPTPTLAGPPSPFACR